MVKTNKTQILKFFEDEEFWVSDETYVESNGMPLFKSGGMEYDDVNLLPDRELISLAEAQVIFPDGSHTSLASFFKKWRTKQQAVTMIVEVHKGHADELMQAIKQCKAKVISK